MLHCYDIKRCSYQVLLKDHGCLNVYREAAFVLTLLLNLIFYKLSTIKAISNQLIQR